VLGWLIIGLLALSIYKKRVNKPKLWKVIIVIYIGLFSFSFNLDLFGTLIKFAILPLGVWVLYFVLKTKENRWEMYRRYAWLGFLGNYIFLGVTLLTIPLQHMLYPQDEASTYIANVKHAEIISTHSSGENVVLKQDTLQKQINELEPESIHAQTWYYDISTINEKENISEKFPYQLVGFTPKWGGGKKYVSNIYVESDGKGLLIMTPKQQLYFRTDKSVLGGESK